jgi:hypothetical protein
LYTPLGYISSRGQKRTNPGVGLAKQGIDPRARAYVIGVPITLRTLWVSVRNPDALIAAVAPAA